MDALSGYLPTIILFMATAATFMMVVVIALPFLQQDQAKSRLKIVTKRREELQAQQRARLQDEKKKSVVRESQIGMMKKVVVALNLQNLLASPELKLKLAGAGYRGPSVAIIFTSTRILTPIVLVLVSTLILFFTKTFEMDFYTKVFITIAAAPAGWFLPGIILHSQLQKRQQDFTAFFPDALDLLVICVEAGLSMEAAFGRVAEEMSDTAPVLAQEFGLTTAELAYLGDRSKALQNLSNRTAIESVRSLTTSLIQTEKYGTPLGTALRVISNENRAKRMAKVEEKAAALGAKLTVPMIAFFLPVIFLVVIGPAVVQMMAL
ncbi:MAG: type II secretion system F family protein [Alphaproteobacteria bacterium]